MLILVQQAEQMYRVHRATSNTYSHIIISLNRRKLPVCVDSDWKRWRVRTGRRGRSHRNQSDCEPGTCRHAAGRRNCLWNNSQKHDASSVWSYVTDRMCSTRIRVHYYLHLLYNREVRVHCVQKKIIHFCFLAYLLEKVTNLNENNRQIDNEMLILTGSK